MHRDLVERAMAGDREAFTELTRRSIGRLYAIARLILRDTERAEDATQEALVAAWKQLSALRDPDRFDAWLRRLLVRACYREAARDQHQRRIVAQIRPSRDGPVRSRASPSPTATSWSEASAACHPSNGHWSCSITTWSCRCTRPPRSSVCPSVRSSPDSSAPPSSCVPPSRRTRDCRSPKGDTHEHPRRLRPTHHHLAGRAGAHA